MTSVTVVVPMTIRRRGGRKQIVGPDGSPVRAGQDGSGVEATRGDPALVKALARAFRWQRMLEDGRYASIRELASAEGVDRSYVGRLLKLTLLAPDVVDALLDGQLQPNPGWPMLLEALPAVWTNQRAEMLWVDQHSSSASAPSPCPSHSPRRPPGGRRRWAAQNKGIDDQCIVAEHKAYLGCSARGAAIRVGVPRDVRGRTHAQQVEREG